VINQHDLTPLPLPRPSTSSWFPPQATILPLTLLFEHVFVQAPRVEKDISPFPLSKFFTIEIFLITWTLPTSFSSTLFPFSILPDPPFFFRAGGVACAQSDLALKSRRRSSPMTYSFSPHALHFFLFPSPLPLLFVLLFRESV